VKPRASAARSRGSRLISTPPGLGHLASNRGRSTRSVTARRVLSPGERHRERRPERRSGPRTRRSIRRARFDRPAIQRPRPSGRSRHVQVAAATRPAIPGLSQGCRGRARHNRCRSPGNRRRVAFPRRRRLGCMPGWCREEKQRAGCLAGVSRRSSRCRRIRPQRTRSIRELRRVEPPERSPDATPLHGTPTQE